MSESRSSRWTVTNAEQAAKGPRTSHYNAPSDSEDDGSFAETSFKRIGRRPDSPAKDAASRRRSVDSLWPKAERIVEAAGDATEKFRRGSMRGSMRGSRDSMTRQSSKQIINSSQSRPSARRSSPAARRSSGGASQHARPSQLARPSRQSQEPRGSRISRYDMSMANTAAEEEEEEVKDSASSCRRSVYTCLEVGLDVCLTAWDCCLPHHARGTSGERALCDRLVIHPDNRGKRLFDALLVLCVVYVVAVVPVEVTWGEEASPSPSLGAFVDIVFIIDVCCAAHAPTRARTPRDAHTWRRAHAHHETRRTHTCAVPANPSTHAR